MRGLVLQVYSAHRKLCPSAPHPSSSSSSSSSSSLPALPLPPLGGCKKSDLTMARAPQTRTRSSQQGRVSKSTLASSKVSDNHHHHHPPLSIKTQRSHLVVLVNGLFGSRANWRVISRLLAAHLDPEDTVVHVSCVNEFTSTYHGIDTCGERLAQEIRDLVDNKHPHLRRISIIGHSMGGLISRYALGVLYDFNTGLVAGCRPCHFMALVTPHLGCQSTPGPAQVPLINWSSRFPGLQRVTSSIAVPLSSGLFGRSGQQFFLRDRDGASPPLLYRLSHDCPEQGLYFWSALAAFESRTLYANQSGDHLVSWTNASLRFPDEQPPQLEQKRQKQTLWWYRKGGRGVVYEDPLDRAFGKEINQDGVKGENRGTLESLPCSDKAHEEYIDASLRSLRRLPWRRIDVCFAAGFLPLLAHQHIQAQRPWINFVGKATATHVAQQMAAMESVMGRFVEKDSSRWTEERPQEGQRRLELLVTD